MRYLGLLTALMMATAAGAAADDGAAKRELAPSGRLRLGIAVGPTIGAGNVVMDAASGRPRGIAVDLGGELASRLAVAIEYVSFPNSGALTDAAAGNAWDAAFIPVDEERKKKVDFGAAHIVLQSTWLVGPDSPIQTLADVDKPGMRPAAVENTATARAAARSLSNNSVTLVRSAEDLLELLRSGQADAIAQSRESLTAMAAKLGRAGARRRLSQFLRRGRGAEGQAGGACLCHRLRGAGEGIRQRAPRTRQWRLAQLGGRSRRREAVAIQISSTRPSSATSRPAALGSSTFASMVAFMCVSMMRRARRSGRRGLSTSQLRWPGSSPE
jgi:polar amino acid transport system substrate-binding protein